MSKVLLCVNITLLAILTLSTTRVQASALNPYGDEGQEVKPNLNNNEGKPQSDNDVQKSPHGQKVKPDYDAKHIECGVQGDILPVENVVSQFNDGNNMLRPNDIQPVGHQAHYPQYNGLQGSYLNSNYKSNVNHGSNQKRTPQQYSNKWYGHNFIPLHQQRLQNGMNVQPSHFNGQLNNPQNFNHQSSASFKAQFRNSSDQYTQLNPSHHPNAYSVHQPHFQNGMYNKPSKYYGQPNNPQNARHQSRDHFHAPFRNTSHQYAQRNSYHHPNAHSVLQQNSQNDAKYTDHYQQVPPSQHNGKFLSQHQGPPSQHHGKHKGPSSQHHIKDQVRSSQHHDKHKGPSSQHHINDQGRASQHHDKHKGHPSQHHIKDQVRSSQHNDNHNGPSSQHQIKDQGRASQHNDNHKGPSSQHQIKDQGRARQLRLQDTIAKLQNEHAKLRERLYGFLGKHLEYENAQAEHENSTQHHGQFQNQLQEHSRKIQDTITKLKNEHAKLRKKLEEHPEYVNARVE